MKSGITRRELAGTILASAAAAQTPPEAPPQTEIEAARAQNQRSADSLAKVEVPMNVEPAFHFTS
jgi:hypothetical protein